MATNSNLPITGRERHLSLNGILVCQTDQCGVINYANDAFADIAGYAINEAVGENLEVLRHPDVPAEVFRQMGRTLERGGVWRGILKNRCKNGDHYWSDACVMPMRINGTTCGYRSVFRRACPEDIALAAETWFRNGDNRASSLHRLQTGIGLAAVTALFIVVLLAAAVVGVRGLADGEQAMDDLGHLALNRDPDRSALRRRVEEQRIANHDLRVAAMSLIALALGGIAAGFVLLSKRTFRPIRERIYDLERLAAGDLSVCIDAGGHGEIGRLNDAVAVNQAQFQWLVDRIRHDGTRVSRQSNQLRHTALRLLDVFEEQHSRVCRAADSLMDTKKKASALAERVEGIRVECARSVIGIERHARIAGTCGETRSRLRRLSASLDEMGETIAVEGRALPVRTEELELDLKHLANHLVDCRSALHELWRTADCLDRVAEDLEKSTQVFGVERGGMDAAPKPCIDRPQ